MRLRYIGREDSTTTFGKTFYRFKWVNASDLDRAAHETLENNPQFEVEPVIEATAADLGLTDPDAKPDDPLDTDPVV